MKLQKPVPTPEKALFLLTMLLCMIGLLFVFEASVAEAYSIFGDQLHFVKQQFMWLVVGMGALTIGIFSPTKYLRKIAPLLYFLSILLLISVLIPGIGKEVNGAKRWLLVGGVTIQPVEMVKLSLILFFADWMEKHQKLPPFLFLTFLPLALLFLQPDMGSALIVIAIAFGMYFAAGAPLKILGSMAALGVLVLSLAVIISPYRMKRITTYLDPESDTLGASFHIHQITLALGNGGWFGQGIGKSRQKFSYIPEASTDSIFAIIAEEVGFAGSVILVILFLAFLHLGYLITKKTKPGSYDHLLANGILLWLGAQIVLNLSAIVALLPLTGVPLPFFSYGGSSLLMLLFATGLLIGIGRRGTHS